MTTIEPSKPGNYTITTGQATESALNLLRETYTDNHAREIAKTLAQGGASAGSLEIPEMEVIEGITPEIMEMLLTNATPGGQTGIDQLEEALKSFPVGTNIPTINGIGLKVHWTHPGTTSFDKKQLLNEFKQKLTSILDISDQHPGTQVTLNQFFSRVVSTISASQMQERAQRATSTLTAGGSYS